MSRTHHQIHKHLEEKNIKRSEIDGDPLRKLDKRQTKRLDSLFQLDEEEYNNAHRLYPELNEVDKFLAT